MSALTDTLPPRHVTEPDAPRRGRQATTTTPAGRLELTWMGKDLRLVPAAGGRYDYAWVEPTDPRATEVRVLESTGVVGDPTAGSDNLLITGDSGDALRALTSTPEWAEKYLGQVKCVYIDPPFNTGQAFTHYDDALEHSVWLTLMRDQLRLIKRLLRPDGSVWVHLDDAEVHRMRCLLDEEFGADNFVAQVIWQKAYAPRNDAVGFSTDQDYVLVYRRSDAWRSNRFGRLASRDALYGSTDGDTRPWISGDPAAPGAKTHQGMVYAIQNPFTGDLIYPARNRCWGQHQDLMQAALEQWGVRYRRADIGDDAKRATICGVPTTAVRAAVPALMVDGDLEESQRVATARYEAGSWPSLYFTRGGQGGLKRKRYLDEVSSTRAPQTLWTHDDVGHNRTAKQESNLLFGGDAFATPKPERLLQRVFEIATDPGDLVLDCFAGSGTSAAVAHKMGRRWVTVELSETNVERYVLPRLTAVVDGGDEGGITTSTERVAVEALPDGVTPEQAQTFSTLLARVLKDPAVAAAVPKDAASALRAATRTREETTRVWDGGGGFTTLAVGPSMYDVDPADGSVYLSAAAVNGRWAAAVAAQLRFRRTPRHPVFCGVRGRQRLAVIDGVLDEPAVRAIVTNLDEDETAVVVAKGVLPDAEDLLRRTSPASRVRKAPDDLFSRRTVR